MLTGCTGFLGAFLLHRLLIATSDSCKIYCLVRAKNEQDGLSHIINTLRSFCLWDDGFATRIYPIIGTLSLPMLGLSNEEYQVLAKNVQIIYHNAAVINSLLLYEQLKPDNVDGTLHLLRLATTERTKVFHYVSTIGVVQGYTEKVFEKAMHEDEQQICRRLDRLGGYGQSKWVAEQYVRQARQRGVPTSIYRPGMIGGDSIHGCCNLSDWVTRFLRGCIIMGLYPDTNKRTLAMIPVDIIADMIIYLSQTQQALQRYCYHLVNTQALAFDIIMQCASNTLGEHTSMREVPFPTWQEELKQLVDYCENRDTKGYDVLWPLLALFRKGFYSQGGTFDNEQTITDLQGSNIVIPALSSNLVELYVRYLYDNALLEKIEQFPKKELTNNKNIT